MERRGGKKVSMDYKEGIQLEAERIAWEVYDEDFYELSEELQDKVYREAEENYIEGLVGRAEAIYDALREGGLK